MQTRPTKMAFLVNRSPEMKVYAPLIIAALAKRVPVFLLCGPNPRESWHHIPTYRPLPSTMEFPGKERVSFIDYQSTEHAVILVKNNSITDIAALDYPESTFLPYITIADNSNARLHCFQFMADYLEVEPSMLKNIEHFFVYSSAMIDIYRQAYPNVKQSLLESKFVVVGNPILDALKEIQSDRSRVLKKYELPADKNIMLFFSVNLGSSFWRKHVFGASNRGASTLAALYQDEIKQIKDIWLGVKYRDIVRVMHEWCQSQNGYLVVKTRSKHSEPAYLIREADRFITDSSTWYPYTPLELLSVAKLVVGLNSTSVLEAAAAGVPNVSINIIQEFERNRRAIHFQRSGVYDWPGVTTWRDYTAFIPWLQSRTLDEISINSQQRAEYIRHFVGPLDGRASERCIRIILEAA